LDILFKAKSRDFNCGVLEDTVAAASTSTVGCWKIQLLLLRPHRISYKISYAKTKMQYISKKADEKSGKLHVAQGSTTPRYSENHTMKAVKYVGSSLMQKSPVKFEDTPKPLLTHDKDVILKVHMSAISGCDLNAVSGDLPATDTGLILGHEAVGTIDEVGPGVKNFKKGDRVVVSLELSCGECTYCQRQEYSECDSTNDSKLFEDTFGCHPPAAILGYSRLLGGVPGCQAEYVRVPFADVNCFNLPLSISNEQGIFLSDILCSSLHATELGCVKQGDVVAIWGMGPIGILAGQWCKVKGAKRVIGIDKIKSRMDIARSKFGIETLDRTGLSSEDVAQKLREMLPKNAPEGGFDVCIEAAGFRYVQTRKQVVQQTMGMTSGTSDILKEMALSARKCGRISIIGDYVGMVNQFPIGAMMQKHLQIKSGFVPVKRYMKKVAEALEKGEIMDPTVLVTQKWALQDAPQAYEKLMQGHDEFMKVLLINNVP
jgi:threonine dehydrogenase-like Zn-dependent dehydrogenase